MNTHRETILQAVVTRLMATKLAQVYRSRVQAFERGDLPAIVVRPGQEQNDQVATNRVKRTLQIIVEVYAASDSTPGAEIAADQAADPIAAGVHAALFATPDARRLGGTVAELFDREMQEPQFADADETRVAVIFIFEAVYMTSAVDITKQTTF